MTAIHVAGPYYLAIRAIPYFKKSADPSVISWSRPSHDADLQTSPL
jgi:hypothetical protein